MTAATTTRFSLTVPGTDDALREIDGVLVHEQSRFGNLGMGIWDLVLPGRRRVLDGFASAYSAVRKAEGRELAPAEVRRLPDIDAGHPLADMWHARAASFDTLRTALVDQPVGSVVDIGAGCGWLSARLASVGWRAAATDVTVSGGDGLAAACHHESELLLARAEMEALPFASSTVDLAVFNASLHYAANVKAALHEACRILRPGGMLAVLDSPVFGDAAAGRAMVEEFASHTRRTLGVPAAQLEGPGFVTKADLVEFSLTIAGDSRGMRSRFHAWRGARRAGRETATRPVLITTVGGRS